MKGERAEKKRDQCKTSQSIPLKCCAKPDKQHTKFTKSVFHEISAPSEIPIFSGILCVLIFFSRTFVHDASRIAKYILSITAYM